MVLLMILLRALMGKAFWWEGRGLDILAGRLSFFVVPFFGPVVQLLTALAQSVAFTYVQIVSPGQPRTEKELQGQVLKLNIMRLHLQWQDYFGLYIFFMMFGFTYIDHQFFHLIMQVRFAFQLF